MATTILLIDDDPLVAFTVERMLQGGGFTVIRAADGEKGLRLLKEQKVDLIITDIIMPVKEGIETIREIREHDAKLPVIAVSGGGHGSGGNYLRMAQALGATEILTKPFDQDELLGAVKRCLKQ
ncbi:MAG TPA: response regulator [Stellaceae bacterium]